MFFMMVQRLVREISSAWTQRLVEHLRLPSTDTRTWFTFLGATTFGTRVVGFLRRTLSCILYPLWNLLVVSKSCTKSKVKMRPEETLRDHKTLIIAKKRLNSKGTVLHTPPMHGEWSSCDSSMNQDKDLKVEVRIWNRKKIKVLF